ncbi:MULTISPECIES: hypothetical protein [unclassified Sphingomonas]|jgi:hypothetical protein|nr:MULTISPECIES: hypothetical protein [unclassified Sphingomonas]
MDSQDILGNMVAALKGELGQGYSVISSFVQNQCYLLARQAENIATSRATGSLRNDDELFAFFLQGLRKNAEDAAKSVVMLSALTIEQAWNAIAGALWGGVRSILTGAGVPAHLLPETPPLNL